MRRDQKISAGGTLVLLVVLVNIIVLEKGLTSQPQWYQLAYVTIPLLLVMLVMWRFRRNK